MSELYKLVAKELKLAPDQHSEQIFKQILKGCSSVVNGLELCEIDLEILMAG